MLFSQNLKSLKNIKMDSQNSKINALKFKFVGLVLNNIRHFRLLMYDEILQN